jgi:hypothetical protein
MKHVWVNAASCSDAWRTTFASAWPTEVTAMPEPKSMSWLPSTSARTAPEARVMKTGSVVETPRATTLLRRSNSSRDFGPGTSVTRRRSCVSSFMACIYLTGSSDKHGGAVIRSLRPLSRRGTGRGGVSASFVEPKWRVPPVGVLCLWAAAPFGGSVRPWTSHAAPP